MLKPKLTLKTSSGKWRRAKQELNTLRGLTIRVGIFDDEGAREVEQESELRELLGEEGLALYKKLAPPKRATLAEIAVFNELGTRTIPARPFIATGMARAPVGMLLEEAARRIIAEDSTACVEAQLIADALAESVRRALEEGPWAPNAFGTIARKGSTQPLIATGRLRAAIRGIVEGD